ncbi:unnamed protein product [Hydatigera taeniaeformis]|uniref:Uncharacterized protein n=1 Tax=Hydatigena taeniaeformis TaxID=6205 RepID=A0A0R3WXM8_HYDTA|nr:unnamed protein product [Hydatigera taeniaeformis]
MTRQIWCPTQPTLSNARSVTRRIPRRWDVIRVHTIISIIVATRASITDTMRVETPRL